MKAKTVPVTIPMLPKLRKQAKHAAVEIDVSLAELIRRALTEYLAENEFAIMEFYDDD